MGKVILKNSKGEINLNIKELFAYKDLFITLAQRDFKVRYTQTFLGLVWAILQPLITLFILVLVFGKVVSVDTGNIPYILFVLGGMCGWQYFAFVVSQSGTSLIGAQAMIHKIYFPRLIIPLSKALVGLIDFAIILFLFLVMMAFYSYKPGISIMYLPVFIALTIVASLAAGIWISALSIRFRDFQVIIPYLLQVGLYITPIAYPINLIPEKYKFIFFLNPMTPVIQGFRWCLLGVDPPDIRSFISYGFVVFLFISGLYYFKKTERTMADIL